MNNLNGVLPVVPVVLYNFINQIMSNPEKIRKIDLFFNYINREGESNLMNIFQYNGILFTRLNVPMTEANVNIAQMRLGVNRVRLPQNQRDILIFPQAFDMNDENNDNAARLYARVVLSYIKRVLIVTGKRLTKIDLYELTNQGGRRRLELIYSQPINDTTPVRPLTPPRRN